MRTESLRDELLEKAESIKVLPTLNVVITEVLRVMNDRNSSFNQLFTVVRYDQAISSKIISIANSAYYSRGWGITNLERAMVAIGFEEIKDILMCLVFLKEILNGWKLSQADLAALWTHTISVACAAKILAGRTVTADPEKAFTVSILHDMGKVIFATYGEPYRRVAQEARETGRDICALERGGLRCRPPGNRLSHVGKVEVPRRVLDGHSIASREIGGKGAAPRSREGCRQVRGEPGCRSWG